MSEGSALAGLDEVEHRFVAVVMRLDARKHVHRMKGAHIESSTLAAPTDQRVAERRTDAIGQLRNTPRTLHRARTLHFTRALAALGVRIGTQQWQRVYVKTNLAMLMASTGDCVRFAVLTPWFQRCT